MLLLRRSPQTFWAPAAVADQLGIKPAVASVKLDALHRRGILQSSESTPAYRFAPTDEPTAKSVEDLVRAYEDQRVNVINAVYSANLERLRTFSNAFRMK